MTNHDACATAANRATRRDTAAAAPSTPTNGRAPFALAALLLACALTPPPAHAQPAPTTQTRPAPSTSPSSTQPAPAPAADKPGDAARRAPAGSIRGRVVGEDGQPLAHAVLYLWGRSTVAPSRQYAPVTSDEDGRFSFDELEPGLYGFHVHLPGYTPDSEAQDLTLARYRLGDEVTIRLVKGGVITGTVTNADGEPVVGASVRVIRVRALDNRPAPALDLRLGNESPTDDRGVYRVYGLPAGVYVVAAGGGQRWGWSPPTPYDDHTPTYFRSATLDTAEEVTVRAGQEVGGVDIRHRGERGHVVSGTLALAVGSRANESVHVTLSHPASGTNAAMTSAIAPHGADGYGFSLEGVADGDYEVRATRNTADGEAASSEPQRVSVRGADVTGLRLTLVPYASVGGDLALEPLREAEGACKTATRRAPLPQEVLVALLRDERSPARRRPEAPQRREATPSDAGAFMLRAVEQGRYRLDARPADEGWYLRDIQLPPTAAAPAKTSPTAVPSSTTKPSVPNAAANNNTTRHTLDLKPGQQLTGLRITVAEGAAALAGRLAPAAADAPLPPPARLRVYLVPAAREQAEDPLRYYEAAPSADGSFALTNLAPGRYLLLARETDADEAARPAGWDSATRARLRREAEAANAAVELQPCQRVNDFAARLAEPRD